MRRRAHNARWMALLWLLAAQAGCSGIGLRRGLDHGDATPEQAARNQQISEHAQEAIDRRDPEAAGRRHDMGGVAGDEAAAVAVAPGDEFAPHPGQHELVAGRYRNEEPDFERRSRIRSKARASVRTRPAQRRAATA